MSFEEYAKRLRANLPCSGQRSGELSQRERPHNKPRRIVHEPPALRYLSAPFHKPGINPTLALRGDLELIQWLDRCGYDEAWLGEHHSAGTELSASPEIMIAAAAERTRHIKLGTGVISVSYHNPLWVAERIVLLDHLT